MTLPSTSDLEQRVAQLEAELTWRQPLPCSPAPQQQTPQWPTITPTGMLQADVVWFDQDDANRQTVGDIENGAEIRRGRIGALGQAAENVAYRLEFEFATGNGNPLFLDTFVDVQQLPFGTFRAGHWIQPIGFNSQTPIRITTFMERSLLQALVPFRETGVGIYNAVWDQRATYQLTAFRAPTDQLGGNVGDSGGFGGAGRLTYLLIDQCDGRRLLHVGSSFGLIDPSNDAIRYATIPEVAIGQRPGLLAPAGVQLATPPFVDTGLVPADRTYLYGGEIAAVFGPLHFLSEVVVAHVDRPAATSVTFSGASTQVGYLLTGEARPYDRTFGFFGRLVPTQEFGVDNGIGAWEIAFRASYLDLSDNDVAGGRLTNLTCGLNWYLNARTRFQFNYLHAFLDRAPGGNSDANIFAARAQVDF